MAKAFMNMAESEGKDKFLSSIITMDETMVSFLTPKTKEQSKEWRLKGSPAPTKPKHQEMRKKQMLFVFFDLRGIIYMHYADIGAKINSSYIVDILGNFLKTFKKKRVDMAASGD